MSPHAPFRRDVSQFLTPMKNGTQTTKSPSQQTSNYSTNNHFANKPVNNKYAHVKSKVNTFWTPQEMQKKGFKNFFERKGCSSASSSASNSLATSPDLDKANKTFASISSRQLHHQIAGYDFAARITELRKAIGGSSPSPLKQSSNQSQDSQEYEQEYY